MQKEEIQNTIVCQDKKHRCAWVGSYTKEESSLVLDYHDHHWSLASPKTLNDSEHFARLSLEIFQAGLSWYVVLKRMEGINAAMNELNPHELATWSETDIQKALQDKRLIRNEQKIRAIIHNAQSLLRFQKKQSFHQLISEFVPQIIHQPFFQTHPISQALLLSNALKNLGFLRVGTTTLFSYLQATGFVFAHAPGCFLHPSNEDACTKLPANEK